MQAKMLRCCHQLRGKREEGCNERQADRVEVAAAGQHLRQRNERSGREHRRDNRCRRDYCSHVRPEYVEVDEACFAFAVRALVGRQAHQPVKAARKHMRIQNAINDKECKRPDHGCRRKRPPISEQTHPHHSQGRVQIFG